MAELHEWPNQHIQQPVTLSQFNEGKKADIDAATADETCFNRSSVSIINCAELHFSARATLRIKESVGMCSPRSILPMWERSIPARFASVSWAIPCLVLSSRTTAPKAMAGSAS